MTDGERHDFDSPWKEALEKFLRPFLALCFPAVEALIDWSREVVFLDKELQALEHDAEAGRQYVDKLIRTYQCDGTEAWILVHVEIQTQPDPQLAERMFLYQERLDLRYRRPVISLAVLADGDPQYRPQSYQRRLGGCWLEFGFPTCKLLDFSEEQLQRPGDPIAFGGPGIQEESNLSVSAQAGAPAPFGRRHFFAGDVVSSPAAHGLALAVVVIPGNNPSSGTVGTNTGENHALCHQLRTYRPPGRSTGRP